MPGPGHEATATARARPNDVAAQITAAYVCDRAGDETQAVQFYDAAWRLGVPSAARAEFIVGYGSTLRNVGRTDEAIALLTAYLQVEPENHAARCFLGLALHAAGRHAFALAELLEIILALDQASPTVTRYRRALSEYRDELRAPAADPGR